MLRGQFLVLLVLVGVPFVDAATGPITHAGPGYVAILLAMDDSDLLSADVTFHGLNTKSIAGAYIAEARRPDNRHAELMVGADGDLNARVFTPHEGEKRIEIQRSGPSFDSGGGAFWLRDTTYFIFFGAGQLTGITVEVNAGKLLGIRTGPEAYALYGDDFHNDTVGAAVHAASSPGAGARLNARAELTMPRPFYGDFSFPLWGIRGLGSASVTHNETTESCPCEFSPGNTEAGKYEFEIDGVGGDGLLFWGVAPELPPLSE